MDAAALKKGFRGRKGSGPRKKVVTRSSKAGLKFPVGRIRRFLQKGRYAKLPRRGSSSLSACRGTSFWPSGMTRSSGSFSLASPSLTAGSSQHQPGCCYYGWIWGQSSSVNDDRDEESNKYSLIPTNV